MIVIKTYFICLLPLIKRGIIMERKYNHIVENITKNNAL